MKISGRIKALILMAFVIYVLAHWVRVLLMLSHPALWPPTPERAPRLGRTPEKPLKHDSRY
ncbi:hypothetical protein [Salinicola aestuarinus]|uniref:hypothetical protein n=1 Tax=Salinicola aestuarinus TaxID=1949082 RepID=UPI000DA2235C|nr:hypothetical protein [Salinicola aestuarinus]